MGELGLRLTLTTRSTSQKRRDGSGGGSLTRGPVSGLSDKYGVFRWVEDRCLRRRPCLRSGLPWFDLQSDTVNKLVLCVCTRSTLLDSTSRSTLPLGSPVIPLGDRTHSFHPFSPVLNTSFSTPRPSPSTCWSERREWKESGIIPCPSSRL